MITRKDIKEMRHWNEVWDNSQPLTNMCHLALDEIENVKNEIIECLKEGTTVSQSEVLVLRKEIVERLIRITK